MVLDNTSNSHHERAVGERVLFIPYHPYYTYMTYIDTQGMGYGESTNEVVEYTPFKPSELTVFSDREKKELKELIHEVLDERRDSINLSERDRSDEWLYRGTY